MLRTKQVTGRSVELNITASGRRLYERILVPAVLREEALLHGFSAAERELLIQFLHRLLDNIPAMNAVWSDRDNKTA